MDTNILFSKSFLSKSDVMFTAGETIAALTPVYVELYFATGTASSVYATDSTTTAKSSASWFVGIAVTASTAGNPIRVRMQGIVNGFSSLTAGAAQYASTSGTLTATAPGNALLVGVAISATQVFVNARGVNTPTARETNQKGYFSGGSSVTTAMVAIGDKITFATDTVAAQGSANLSTQRRGACSVWGGVTKGYFSGGMTSTALAVTTGDKITFSNDTVGATTSANLTSARGHGGGLSEQYTKGYFLGGLTSNLVSVITSDKITYSTDTAAAVTAANLSQQRGRDASVSDALTKGYVVGGTTVAASASAVADLITYSTDTRVATTTANLTSARWGVSGMTAGYGNGKGYFIGGRTATNICVVTSDKITFSTNATAAQTTVNLPAVRADHGTLSEGNTKGYCCGGSSGLDTAIVNTGYQVTFATDSIIAKTTANLSTVRSFAPGLSAAVP